MKQVVAQVISNREIIPQGYLLWLEAPSIVSEAKPGQFVMVNCGEDTLLPRPLSVHQRDGDKIALLVNVIGKGTEWLSKRQKGDTVELFGPLGNGFTLQPEAKNILMIAGGIGVAPLYFLAQKALSQECSVTLLLGAQTKTQLYPKRLLPPEVKIIIANEDGTTGKKGVVTDLISDFAGGADQIVACGPLPMYQTMAQMPELKDKAIQVSLEIMMACGRGICYGCTIKTRQGLKKVCQDGPVFDLNDILWDDPVFTTGQF